VTGGHRLRRAVVIATAIGAALGGACLAIDGWRAAGPSPPPQAPPTQAASILAAEG
jgi:hypothetical protein